MEDRRLPYTPHRGIGRLVAVPLGHRQLGPALLNVSSRSSAVQDIIEFPRGFLLGDWQGFYSPKEVARITGVPLGTLREWQSRGIVKPSIEAQEGARIKGRGYSYADLTLIRILRALREDRLDFKSVGIALRHLYARLGPPSSWANATVHIVGNRIYVDKSDEWEWTVATLHGQRIETRLFGDKFSILRELEEGILVPRRFREYVEINPKVMGGEPVVRGTRVPTALLAMLRDNGKRLNDIVHIYRPIAESSIRKAIEYERFLDRQSAPA